MTGAGNNHMGGPQSGAYPGGAMAKGGAGGVYNSPGMPYPRRDSHNRYGGAGGSNPGLMTPGHGPSPHLPGGVMSSSVPLHMTGVRQVTTHTQVHVNPLGGGGMGGVEGSGGPAGQMPLASCHPMRSTSQGPPASSPVLPMGQVQSPLNSSMRGMSSGNSMMHGPNSHNPGQSQSAMNQGMQTQSPVNPGMQPQSPHNSAMSGPMNAAMQGQGQVQAPSPVVKPSMIPSPLHGDPVAR